MLAVLTMWPWKAGGQHHGGEYADTVGYAHQVHTDHPLPVLQGVFPDQAARADAGVVEHKVGGAKARKRGRTQRLHLVGLGHVHAHAQHSSTGARHFGHCAVQCVLLNIG